MFYVIFRKKKEKSIVAKETSSDSKSKLITENDSAVDEALKEKDAKSEAELILMQRHV
jgi:hypothetical protein